jgi:hypothetical protein
LVWLYFLLAGGAFRKRALQTAALTTMLVLPSVFWVYRVAPHWIYDLRSNIAATSVRGGINDPSPASPADTPAATNISLQEVFSVFYDNPRFYNFATFLVCGTLLIIWMVTVLRSRSSEHQACLALAAIVPLSMLATYHRIYDAKLLLLTVPACAMLWSRRGLTGWIALILNSVVFFVNGDVPITILNQATKNLHLSIVTLSGKFVTVLLARPNQECLLALSLFYLWTYISHSRSEASEHSAPVLKPATHVLHS